MTGLNSIPATAPTPPVRRGTCNSLGGPLRPVASLSQTARTFFARFASWLAAGRESECGVPVVTSAMAELNGRRLTDPENDKAIGQGVVVAYSEMVRRAGDLISGGAVAISDTLVTPAEATKMDRDAAELQEGIAVLRKALATVKASGGEKLGLHVVGGQP